jgi:hypothetical protein
MTQVDEEIVLLLEKLDSHFGSLPVPEEDCIVSDNSGYHLECSQVRALLCNRHWQRLSAKDLVGEAESLFFLTPTAFRFYLPAFIKLCLLEPELADITPDVILSSLASPAEDPAIQRLAQRDLGKYADIFEELVSHKARQDRESLREGQERRRSELSPGQRETVRRFVRFLTNHRSEEFYPECLEAVENSLE